MTSLASSISDKFNLFLFVCLIFTEIATMTALSFTVGDPTRSDSSSSSSSSFQALIPSQVLFSNAYSLKRNDKSKYTKPSFCGVQLDAKSESHDSIDHYPPKDNNNLMSDNYQPKREKRVNQRWIVREGNYPDLEWRAIPMDHLRCHPLFKALPMPEDIQDIDNVEDVRYFRQRSWQWDALHKGRCTTSQLSAALGFLETKAGVVLGIPKSLQHGPMSAYQRLGEKPLGTLLDIKNALCIGRREEFIYNSREMNHEVPVPSRIWKKMDPNRYPFAAKYNPRLYPPQIQARRRTAIRNASSLSSQAHRMIWGNTQEATAILTAVNYVSKLDPGVIVHEAGMCGAGLHLNTTVDANRLLVGASPDAIIQYSDGSLEALEVKNHCPFVPCGVVRNTTSTCQYRVRELPLNPTVPTAYFPQLMMEIMCLGPNCSSAMMVRQTATSGAVILRVYRDDAWIQEMLYWLKKFLDEYVTKEVIPPKNFFWDDHLESTRYREFVLETKRKAESVELVSYISNNSIQRVTADSGQFLPLFLD